jgi:putative addiction module component (TIGR02574 family)
MLRKLRRDSGPEQRWGEADDENDMGCHRYVGSSRDFQRGSLVLFSAIMAVYELFAQAARLSSEERRFLAEIIWETVDADLPAQWEKDSTISAEVERRFEEFKAGRERGLSHDEVFAAAKIFVV